MRTTSDKQKRAVRGVCNVATTVLLLQLATASADSLVPGAWVQRAAGQHAAVADKRADDQFSSLEVIGLEELGGMRGGLRVGGLNIDVGAVVRTIVDGKLALESHISFATANEIAAAIGVTGGTAGNAATPISDYVTIQSSNGAENPISNPASVVINDSKGFTQVMHDVTQDRVVSAIVNQADGRAIRQEIDVNITVSNFRELQRATAMQSASQALARSALSRPVR